MPNGETGILRFRLPRVVPGTRGGALVPPLPSDEIGIQRFASPLYPRLRYGGPSAAVVPSTFRGEAPTGVRASIDLLPPRVPEAPYATVEQYTQRGQPTAAQLRASLGEPLYGAGTLRPADEPIPFLSGLGEMVIPPVLRGVQPAPEEQLGQSLFENIMYAAGIPIPGMRLGAAAGAAAKPVVKAVAAAPRVAEAVAPKVKELLIDFLPTEEVIRNATQPSNYRRMMKRIGEAPFRGLVEWLDPAAMVKTIPEKHALAYLVDEDTSIQAVNVIMSRMSLLPDPVKTFGVAAGRAAKVPGNPAWGDVLEYPAKYALTNEQRILVDALRAPVREAEVLLAKYGVKRNLITGFNEALGEGFWPRLVEAVRGIKTRMPGRFARQSSDQPRIHLEAETGVQRGVDYGNSPIATLEVHLRGVYRAIALQRFVNVMLPLGRTARAPVEVLAQAARAKKIRDATKKIVDVLQRANRREMIPSATLRALTKQGVPEETLAAIRSRSPEKIKPHLDSFKGILQTAKVEAQVATNVRALRTKLARKPFPGEEAIRHRLFAGRFFPSETAEVINRVLGDRGSQWLRTMESVNMAMRAPMTTLDLAAPFLQGLPVLARYPVKWTKATLTHAMTVIKPRMHAELIEREWGTVAEMVQHNVPMGSTEFTAGVESGRLLGKLPILPRFAKAFVMFGDLARILIWKAQRGTAIRSGPTGLSELGAYVRNMTGATSLRVLGIGTTQRMVEANLWFASRYLRGTIALVLDAAQGGLRGSEARRAFGSMLAAGALWTIGVGRATGLSWEEIGHRIDPRNPEFMTLPFMGLNVGPGSGYVSLLRLVGELYEAASERPDELTTLDPRRNVFTRWLRGKSSPVVSLAVDEMFAEDFLGREVNIAEPVIRRFLPLSVQQMLSGGEGLGIKEEAAAVGVGFAGLRAYPESPRRTRDELAQRFYNKQWEELNLAQQAKIRTVAPRAVEAAPREFTGVIDVRREKIVGEAVQSSLSKSVQDEMNRLDVDVGPLSRTIGPEPRLYLSDVRYERYKELTTQYLRTMTDYAMQQTWWNTVVDEAKREALKQIVMVAKAGARDTVLAEATKEGEESGRETAAVR